MCFSKPPVLTSKRSPGCYGNTKRRRSRLVGGRIEEVLKKDVKRSLVFDLVDLPSLGIQTPDIGNGMGTGSKIVFKQAAEKGVSVLVWGKAGLKGTDTEADVNMEGFVYDSGSNELVGGSATQDRPRL